MRLDHAIAAKKPLVRVAAIAADPQGITRDAYGRHEVGMAARCHCGAKA